MGIEIGFTQGCVFTAGYDVFHTGIRTDSEAPESRRRVLRLLLWHGKAVEPFVLLHGQFDFV